MLWETFSTSKETKTEQPNMFVYDSQSGAEVFATVQKKTSDWEACWSRDESLMAIMIGGESLFYETKNADGFTKSAKKIGGGRNGMVSVAPNAGPNAVVALYTPGAKGSPSMCKLYRYPDVQASQPLACKSFFQVSSVQIVWW